MTFWGVCIGLLLLWSIYLIVSRFVQLCLLKKLVSLHFLEVVFVYDKKKKKKMYKLQIKKFKEGDHEIKEQYRYVLALKLLNKIRRPANPSQMALQYILKKNWY